MQEMTSKVLHIVINMTKNTVHPPKIHEGELLKKYLKEHKINQEEFAVDQLGITRQGLQYHFTQEALKFEFKDKLRQAGLVIFNEAGKPLVVNEPDVVYKSEDAAILDKMGLMKVHVVNQYAYAGYLSGYADPEYIDTLPTEVFPVDREYRGKYLCFEVRGDSMNNGTDSSYHPGDLLLGREVKRELWRDKLHIKRWNFIIVHRTDGIIVKKILEHNTANGDLLTHSLNPQYDNKIINLRDVVQIFNVIKLVRNE
jgi:phage repressor protein C with HTH and peptisase S24 domain